MSRHRDSKTPKKPDELIEFVEELKHQWMSTIDALVDPLMIVSKDYKIQKANIALAHMAGKDVKELVGGQCYEVFAGRQSPCPGCAMHEAAESREARTFDLDQVRADRYYEASSQPLIDSDGNIDGIVQVYRDRTDAKKLQEKLVQQEKLASIGLLAGGVAHEINNPLGGILIFAQMLLREMDESSPHYEDVKEIENATQRCKAIVESLLNFARQRPDDDSEEETVDDVNPVDAMKTALRFGKVSLQSASQVQINEEIPELQHMVQGDRNKLIQLFLNLIQNGIQAMPDGGQLFVRARQSEGDEGLWGVYEVEDTGVGIPEENLSKIFDPFFTTKDPGEGTGLGLALCYGIARDMGGDLEVHSELNVGTKFVVRLPLRSGERSHQPAS